MSRLGHESLLQPLLKLTLKPSKNWVKLLLPDCPLTEVFKTELNYAGTKNTRFLLNINFQQPNPTGADFPIENRSTHRLFSK